MAVSTPIAANRIAILGCVAKQATKAGMGAILRLSFESLLPAADRMERLGAPVRAARLPRKLRGGSMEPTASERQPDHDGDAWRGDGRMLMARYPNHMLNVMPSQKTLKSKAFASA
jgi:hypothetical protein